MRRAMNLAAADVLLLVALAHLAEAQPVAWSAWRDREEYLGPVVSRLSALDVGTRREVSLPLPDNIDFGKGVLTPDGKYYLLPTSVGIARFTTSPPVFDRLLGAGVPVGAVTVEPSGSRLHATGTFGHAVLDWATGDLFGVECCSQPRISFSPNGAFSVFVEALELPLPGHSRISAFSEPAHRLLWSRTVPGQSAGETVGDTYVAVHLGGIVIWSLIDGVERARLDSYGTTGSGMAWQDDDTLLTWEFPGRLSAYDVTTAQKRVLVDAFYGIVGGLHLTSDARYAYATNLEALHGARWVTYVQVIDLTTNTRVSSKARYLAGRRQLTLEDAPLCTFSVGVAPESMPGEGGIFGVPVIPGPGCRAWSEPDALNPGPHVGATTIFFGVAPSVWRGESSFAYSLADRVIRLTQAGAVPGAPELTVGVAGNRATLRWSPTVGGGVTSWSVRGGLAPARAPLMHLARIEAGARSWTSPLLPPGSYEAEVVPIYLAKGPDGPYELEGPASTRVRFSVGVTDLPLAPTSVTAVVVDDTVSLQWLAPVEGPAPSSYLVEAAPAGHAVWVPVTTTLPPLLIVPRVPPGDWRVRVRAKTEGGFGVPSSPLEITVVACRIAPGAPQGVWAVVTGSTATLRWSRPAVGAVHEYILEVGLRYGENDIGRFTIGGSVHEVTVPVPQAGTHYFIQVRARNDCGESPPSNSTAIPIS